MKKRVIVIVLAVALLQLSFSKESGSDAVAHYYDQRLNCLLGALLKLQHAEKSGLSNDSLKNRFFDCRNDYKKVEFLIDVFNPYKARQFNGPDLLKIEEENPQDSIKPHGLQHIETLLFTSPHNKSLLADEIEGLLLNTRQLLKDPDRIYYFENIKIWEAMRLGTFRVVSLGITGFDVPLSHHALPEARATLKSIEATVGFYKTDLPDSVYKRGVSLFSGADEYLRLHNDFNSFDRMVFIRDHMNGISEWITRCGKNLGYITTNQQHALNPAALNLFSHEIIDINFFSPNENYRITPERVALGKQLFFDSRLSGNGTRSCASCHLPEKGFADGLPKPLSLIGDKTLLRNTPTLLNAALQKRQFYDSRTETLENQLSSVVHNSDEMNGSLKNSIETLKADKAYFNQFRSAYPGSSHCVTEYNIANAIASYVRSLISLNSRFDKYMRRDTDSFSASEKNGFNLFMGKAQCGTCHYAPLFSGLTPPLYQETESEILAVPAFDKPLAPIDSDPGKYGFTKVPLHKYAFKTPTVRNTAITAPYMHNGVFTSLEDVIHFYNEGGGAGRGIDLPTQTLSPNKLHLTKKEIKDIVAFLKTLTDEGN